MFRTLPDINELFSDMIEAGKTSEVAGLLPVPYQHAVTTSSIPSYSSCVGFSSCEFENRQPTLVLPPVSDWIVPKLTHMAADEIPDVVAPVAADLACVVDDNEECLCGVKVELVNEALWKKLHTEGNEMIVTKTGRSMFPVPEFNITGLSPTEDYKLEIRFVFIDEFRYRFCTPKNAWYRAVTDKIEPTSCHRRCFEHPTSPNGGAILTERKLSFDKVRGTSYLRLADNMIYLPTMRKYRIQLVITELHCDRPQARCFDFPATEFVSVSNYKNMKLKQLKIDHNPYAKSFREGYKRSIVIPFKSTPKYQERQENRKRKREDNNSRTPAVREAPTPTDLTPAACDLSPAQSCTSKRRTHSPASSTSSSSGIPTGYIDLTDYASIPLRHENYETVVSPTDHTTYAVLQPMELHAYQHTTPGYAHTYFSTPPAWSTPNHVYHFYKDDFTMEVNAPKAYNYNYSYDNFHSCNADRCLDSSVEDYQGLVALRN